MEVGYVIAGIIGVAFIWAAIEVLFKIYFDLDDFEIMPNGMPKFMNPPPPPKKRYRWNIYWHVWDEWDAKEKCFMSEFPPPIIVSRRIPQRPAQS